MVSTRKVKKVDLIEEIQAYHPFNQQEEKDKEQILFALSTFQRVFFRDNLFAHMTASAWVVNENKDKVLMAYHNLYQSWAWLGGHADGEQNLLQVAIREAQEESGLQKVRPLQNSIYSLEVLTVDGHIKHGNYVPSHIHLNLTYLLEANEKERVSVKADENSGVAWFSFSDAQTASTERWYRDNIYSKLIAKL